jgi:hypothetical protein
MNPTAKSSSQQPSVAILPIDALEHTLRDLGVDIDVQSFIEKVHSRHALSMATELGRYPEPLVAHHEAGPSVEPNSQRSVRPYSPTSASSTQSSPVATLQADSLSDTGPVLVEMAQRLESESLMPTSTAEASPKMVSESSMPTPVAKAAPQTESESTQPIPEDVADAAWRVAVRFHKSLPPFTAKQQKGICESTFSSLLILLSPSRLIMTTNYCCSLRSALET